jgi:serine O-acetyltransferase
MGFWKETIQIVKENDPAARGTLDILLNYPGVKALAAHKWSHFLYKKRLFILANINAQIWRFFTQIEIHPGAQIANGVFIDHGGGLVIGETAIVEKGVLLYHGVTLGGTGRDEGHRHPIIRQNALISAHSQIIGPIEIGRDAKIGAGAVVNKNIPDGATVVGIPGRVVKIYGKRIG